MKIKILTVILLCLFACSKKKEEKDFATRSLQALITNKPVKKTANYNSRTGDKITDKVKFYEEAIAVNEMLQKGDENAINYKVLSNYLAKATFDQCNDIAFYFDKKEYWASRDFVGKFMLRKSSNIVQSNQALCIIAVSQLMLENLDAADKAANKIKSPNGNSVSKFESIYALLAPEYFDNGDIEKAYNAYKKLNDSNLDFSKVMKNTFLIGQAKCAAFIGKYDEAKGIFNKLMENPNLYKNERKEIEEYLNMINNGTITNEAEKKKERITPSYAYEKAMEIKFDMMHNKLTPTKRRIYINRINKLLKQLNTKSGEKNEKSK